jgi:hypothetical protein
MRVIVGCVWGVKIEGNEGGHLFLIGDLLRRGRWNLVDLKKKE